MSDLYDQAQDAAELFLNASLSKRKDSPKATGKCHWCDSPVDAGVQFFDTDCRDDYTKSKRMSARLEAI